MAPPATARSPEPIADPAFLLQAWRKVRGNGGGPGGDGVRLDQFAARLRPEIAQLATELAAGRYRPGPLRRVRIPKPDGGSRMLAIPCVRDRVAQTALLVRLHPTLDARQSAHSFGYRPARGVADALEAVRRAHAAGLVWTLEADIAQCFDRVPHRRLLQDLAIWIETEAALRLIALWLDGFSSAGVGIAQGAPIAPLLCNLYLHPLDRLLVTAGYAPVRYADDFVVLTADAAGAARARAAAAQVLAERGLALQPAKTRIVPPGVGFRFLGETLRAPPAPRRAGCGR